MFRVTASAALVAILFSGAAQAASPLDYAPVYDQCKIVSDDPPIADMESGLCVTATRAYVAGIPQPLNAASDEAITELVVKLAELPWVTEDECDEYEEEIPEAIRIASKALVDEKQATRLNEVADTMVEQCGTGVTASISADALASQD